MRSLHLAMVPGQEPWRLPHRVASELGLLNMGRADAEDWLPEEIGEAFLPCSCAQALLSRSPITHCRHGAWESARQCSGLRTAR